MNKEIHQNYIKSSNLLFAISGIIFANFTLLSTKFKNSYSITLVIAGIVFFIAVAFLIRRGYNWTKFLLIAITLFGIVTVPMIVFTFNPTSIFGIFNIAQQVLLVSSITLLFLIPKTQVQ